MKERIVELGQKRTQRNFTEERKICLDNFEPILGYMRIYKIIYIDECQKIIKNTKINVD